MTLVDHDNVEVLDGEPWRVRDGDRLAAERTAGLEQRLVLVCRVVLGIALEHRVETLDGRDDHLAGRLDLVAAQVLDRVLPGEGVGGAGIPELLELVQRLLSEVVAVYQEQDALGIGVLDKPVAGANRRERLPAARRHVD